MKTSIVFQLFILSLVGLVGTALSRIVPLSIPPSIIGMLLLLLLLVFKFVRLQQIGKVGHFFLANMGVLFIPPVVEIAERYQLLGNQALLFVGICVVSTILTFLSSLAAAKFVMRLQDKYRKSEDSYV
ncbi:CidA/LrgA family protein [Pleomorphochaeta sp. DL1XJH-081]|uniref:CidA/LrgA family protein n=1 Tax=Pleomorphochaeta sp. DL1XJH-081 TaxID=3409690 RepID=UPI003BB749E5